MKPLTEGGWSRAREWARELTHESRLMFIRIDKRRYGFPKEDIPQRVYMELRQCLRSVGGKLDLVRPTHLGKHVAKAAQDMVMRPDKNSNKDK